MQQSPAWGSNSSLASQEIPRVLCNPKVPYRVHKSPPRVPILSQINPVHASSSCSLKIYFHILPFPHSFFTCSFAFRFKHQNRVCTCVTLCRCFSLQHIPSMKLLYLVFLVFFFVFVLPMARQPLGGLGLVILRRFTITLRHTTLGRTPLDEWSARPRDLYLTTHNRQTSMP
jgi:hypothetical protein